MAFYPLFLTIWLFGAEAVNWPSFGIILRKVYTCEDLPAQKLQITPHFEDDRIVSMDLETDLDEEFNNYWSLDLLAEIWESGEWKMTQNPSDNVCSFAENFFNGVWKKLREAASIPSSEPCNIQPGHYSVKEMQLDREDFTFPLAIPGRFRATLKILDDSDNIVICQMIELDIL